jgi:hypothetical protein
MAKQPRIKGFRNAYVIAMQKRGSAGAGRHKNKRAGRGGAKDRVREYLRDE